MNIGEVAERSNLPAKTIRYYEDVGLVRPRRSANGYRSFADREVHKLAFVARARSLGFTIDDCRLLLSLYENRERSSAEVRSIARQHLERIDCKIVELEGLRDVLCRLIAACRGDERPQCPILDDLAGDEKDR